MYLKKPDDIKIFSGMPKYEIKYRVRGLSLWIPGGFAVAWIVLGVTIGIGI